MALDQETIIRIRNALRFKPKGMSITDLASQLRMNRNSVSKYLEILVRSGEAEARNSGTSRIYTVSQCVPASAMMRFSSDMIVMIDHKGTIFQVNEPFLSFSGIPRESLIGQTITSINNELIENLPISGYLKEVLEQQTSTLSRSLKREGKDFFFLIKLVPTLFDDGSKGLTIIIEDISDQKRAEHALADREKLYHDVIENIQDIFYRSDKNGNLIMASPSWAHLLGYDSVDECLGRSIADDFYMQPAKRRDLLAILKTEGTVWDYEVDLKKKDGTPASVSTNSHIYYTPDGSELGVEGIFRDISERKAARTKIHKYIVQIEYISQKLLEFIRLPGDADIFSKIAGDLKELLPDAIIMVNSYNNERGTLTVQSTTLDQHDEHIVKLALGRDFIGFEAHIDAVGFSSLRTGELFRGPLSLHETFFKAVPEPVCNELSHTFSIGDVHAIGLVCEGTLLGNILICMKQENPLKDPDTVQMYIRQASIALKRAVTENSLKKSEEVFSNIAEHSPLAIAIIDTSGTYTYINRNFSRIFGYTLKNFQTGREWFLLAFPDPDYRNNVISDWKTDLASSGIGEPRPRMYTVRCKDGSEKEIFFRPVMLSDGKQCIVYEDVTERRDAERVRKLLASIVESTDDAIIGKTPEGIIISWNSAAEHLFGYSRDEIIGRHISIIVPPEKRKELEGIFDTISRGGRISDLETLRIRKNGTIVEVSITISPIIDEDRQVIGVSTISRDITAKKAEERLKGSEEKYRNLVENITIGVYRSTGDPKGKFVWGNPYLVEILGYSSLDHLKAVTIADIFSQPNGRAELLADLQRSGFVKNREITLKRADGELIWVSVTAVANIRTNGEIEYINGIVEDITRIKKIEKQVKILNRKICDIIEFIPDPAFIVNENHEVCAWNTGMVQLTGVKKEEILGKTSYSRAFPFFGTSSPVFIDMIDANDDDLQKLYPVMAGVTIHHEGAFITAEIFAPGLYGNKGGHLWAKAGPLTDENGNRIGAIEILRDITGDRNIEKYLSTLSLVPGLSLKDVADLIPHANERSGSAFYNQDILSYRYLSGALKHAGDYLAILDLSGRCLWANDALISSVISGTLSELTGISFAQFVAPEFRKLALDCMNAVRKEGVSRINIMLLSPNGRIPVEVHFSAVNDDKDHLLGYLVIARSGKNDSRVVSKKR
jgi:PAS domain S-box-containing protein